MAEFKEVEFYLTDFEISGIKYNIEGTANASYYYESESYWQQRSEEFHVDNIRIISVCFSDDNSVTQITDDILDAVSTELNTRKDGWWGSYCSQINYDYENFSELE